MLSSVIIVVQNCNKNYYWKVNKIKMGRRSKKRINNIRLREIGRSKRVNRGYRRLEKFEKANRRKKLKSRIKMRLKELTRVINLNYQYLG